MGHRFVEHCEMQGNCKTCGNPVNVQVPLHIDSSDKNIICSNLAIPHGSCGMCSERTPLFPIPIVYWSDSNWVGLVLDGTRPASYILRMVLSWIADDRRNVETRKFFRVRVFCSIEALSYVLREKEAGSYIQDVKSMIAPYWAVEVIAIAKFLDDALALNHPALAYGFMVDLIRSYPDFFDISEVRGNMEIVAHACGNESISSDLEITALDHFREIQAEWDKCREFCELDEFSILLETPVDIRTGVPTEGSFNPIHQNTPECFAVSDVNCRILCGVSILKEILRKDGGNLLAATEAESIAVMTLSMHWRNLEENQRADILSIFKRITNLDMRRVFPMV